MKVVLLCLGLLFGVVGPVFSTSVFFDFSSSPDAYLAVPELTLNIEATSIGRTSAEINWSKGFGFGVLAAPNESGTVDSGTLDGLSSDDVLTFEFGTTVVLREIVFSWVNDYDLFELWIGDSQEAAGLIDASGSEIFAYDFSTLQLASSSFSVMASASNASFRIKSIKVATFVTPIPAPEPATWLLFGVGLLGVVLRRKKSPGQ